MAKAAVAAKANHQKDNYQKIPARPDRERLLPDRVPEWVSIYLGESNNPTRGRTVAISARSAWLELIGLKS